MLEPMAKLKSGKSLVRALLSSLLLCGTALSIAPAVGGCGGAQRTETGTTPAADAEMKLVVLNVFGMT